MSDQPDAHSIIHSRLERREEYVDAAQFLSLFASAEFVLQGVFGTLAIVGLSVFYRSSPSPFGVVEHLGAALLALILAWIIYRGEPASFCQLSLFLPWCSQFFSIER
jgi:hypothetical protein